MVTHAALPPAAHRARAIVLPAPGGPVSAVTGPPAPWAMSAWIRGRGISHSGTTGTVTLDARSGSPAPAACRPESAVSGVVTLVTIATASAQRAAVAGRLHSPSGLARLVSVPASTRAPPHPPPALPPG